MNIHKFITINGYISHMKELPDIIDGDDEFDIIGVIMKNCGIKNSGDYGLITREMFEKNLPTISDNLNLGSSLVCQILGYFTLTLGADIPEDLRLRIIEASLPENDEYRFHNKKFQEARIKILNDLHQKILNHKPGRIQKLLEDGGTKSS